MGWWPTQPGYHESVTGQRAVPDRPGMGPTHVYGEVHRCGPTVARWWVRLGVNLGLLDPDIERVWVGPKHPVSGDPLGAQWQAALRAAQNEAKSEAARLNALDPQGIGGVA